MENIEVEVRSFISKEKYEVLLGFFKRDAEFIKEDYQETYYFDCDEDLRIQKNDYFSKIWMKKGVIHDESREETEIKFDKDDFDKLEKLFLSLGYGVKIKWFRKRFAFKWKGMDICLDYTKGYGYIIELEKMCSPGEEKETLGMLKQNLNELDVELTPRGEFDKQYEYYKKNWRGLI